MIRENYMVKFKINSKGVIIFIFYNRKRVSFKVKSWEVEIIYEEGVLCIIVSSNIIY